MIRLLNVYNTLHSLFVSIRAPSAPSRECGDARASASLTFWVAVLGRTGLMQSRNSPRRPSGSEGAELLHGEGREECFVVDVELERAVTLLAIELISGTHAGSCLRMYCNRLLSLRVGQTRPSS